jgi:hypothetical protein
LTLPNSISPLLNIPSLLFRIILDAHSFDIDHPCGVFNAQEFCGSAWAVDFPIGIPAQSWLSLGTNIDLFVLKNDR